MFELASRLITAKFQCIYKWATWNPLLLSKSEKKKRAKNEREWSKISSRKSVPCAPCLLDVVCVIFAVKFRGESMIASKVLARFLLSVHRCSFLQIGSYSECYLISFESFTLFFSKIGLACPNPVSNVVALIYDLELHVAFAFAEAKRSKAKLQRAKTKLDKLTFQ